jgi:hypothetical protein
VSMTYNIAMAMFFHNFLGGVPRRLNLSVMKTSKEKIEGIGGLVKNKEVKPVLDGNFTIIVLRKHT